MVSCAGRSVDRHDRLFGMLGWIGRVRTMDCLEVNRDVFVAWVKWRVKVRSVKLPV